MKRAFIHRAVLFLLALGLVFPFPGNAEGNESSKKVKWVKADKAVETARSTGKVILYKFGAEWCGPCRAMKEVFFNNQLNAEFINKHFIPVEVVDRAREEGRNPAWIEDLHRKYPIRGFPTLVLVSLKPGKSASINGWGGSRNTRQEMEMFLKKTGRLKIPVP